MGQAGCFVAQLAYVEAIKRAEGIKVACVSYSQVRSPPPAQPRTSGADDIDRLVSHRAKSMGMGCSYYLGHRRHIHHHRGRCMGTCELKSTPI